MHRRHFLAAKGRYCCEWTCTHCGRRSRERGEVRAADHIRINQFTDNLHDEVNLSGELAQEKARRRLFRLQEAVNDMHWLAGLRVAGLCRKCGRRQFWSPLLRHLLSSALALACFAGLMWLAGPPAAASQWFACLAASAAIALLTEGTALLLIRRRLERLPDPEAAPRIHELFPSG